MNQLTGNDLDYRDGTFAKAQLMVTPNANWQARVIYSHERNRDGDYALGDLDAIRANAVRRDARFRGLHQSRHQRHHDQRARHRRERCRSRATTGFVTWKTEDETDLDYTPLPLATRSNAEEDFQFTQEVRFASPENAPLQLSDTRDPQVAGRHRVLQPELRAARGQHAVARSCCRRSIPFPVAQTSPESAIDTSGFGLFGHGTMSFNEKIDLTVGLRFDHEQSDAALNTLLHAGDRAGQPGGRRRHRSRMSRRSSPSAFRPTPDSSLYASASRGFKAGGFNPAALPGSEAYGEEHAWHLEGGVKSTLAGGRVSASAAVFSIEWDDLQLNVPNPFVPGQFYISNVGGARSSGVEFDLTARPHPSIDLFASFGYTHARFARRHHGGRRRRRPTTSCPSPPTTPACSARSSRARSRSAVTLYGRGEVVMYGRVRVRRSQHRAAGRLQPGQLPRRRPRQVAVRRNLDPQRLRHDVRADRHSLPGVCAVGFHRREWPPAHVRRQRRRDVLDHEGREGRTKDANTRTDHGDTDDDPGRTDRS